ncbi:hypothetical protein DPMN_110183 [Dreissena polymorpha]|uniref:Uncharacterized protein n=1 Tax=Dreissena polymorpha TaxID=45954 RepID=A0A9D4KC45_DREPO|nr:hypothetical protein DPMN_110183 [Dreissena polymorpha]
MWGMHVLQTALVSIDFSKTHQQASVNCADQMQSTGFTLVLSESMSTADSEEPGSLTHDRREPSEEPASLTHDRREPSEEPASLTHGISIII